MSYTQLTIRMKAEEKEAIAGLAESLGLTLSGFATAVLLQCVRDGGVVLSKNPSAQASKFKPFDELGIPKDLS